MQTTVMRAGMAGTSSSSWSSKDSSNVRPSTEELPSVQCVSGVWFTNLTTRGRSILRLRADRSRTHSCGSRSRRLVVRAEQPSSVGDEVKEIASDKAVEGPGIADREAKGRADELGLEDQQPGTGGEATATGLLLKEEEVEEESSETAVERDTALDVASTSAVEDTKTFFKDVEEDASVIAADLHRPVDDAFVGLENKAEDLEERQGKEAELVKKYEFEEGTTTTTNDGEVSISTRAEDEIVETAKDGYEVLKWVVDGIVSAGQSAAHVLGLGKVAVDKRVKSFGIAAKDARDVSSQVAGVAQKNVVEMHGLVSKFEEEVQVNLKEKEATDSLKPESERHPLAKLGHDIEENFSKATSEDGALAQLSESLSENFSKVSLASQELGSQVSVKGAEFSSKASEIGAEITDNVKENAGEIASKIGGAAEYLRSSIQNGSASKDIQKADEDERGNELLEGQISDKDDTTTFKFDVDEPRVIPSKKQTDSDIGPDE